MNTQKISISDKNSRYSGVITAGLALFSMFFGAGNLIFPILVGRDAGINTWYGILGLGLTAVLVPFLGLTAMVLFGGDYRHFFARLGKIPGRILFFILQLILGPFGVIPRLITLMHAMMKPYLFNIGLMPFSILVAILIFGFCFRRHQVVSLIGSVLTPIKLFLLATLIGIGLSQTPDLNPVHASAGQSFYQGLMGGYNTMDLIAAFVFATIVMPHFCGKEKKDNIEADRRNVLKKMVFSSSIAAALLLLTYMGLAWISSYHVWTLDPSYPPEEMLGAIAHKILGPIGGCIAAFAVVMACLTTTVTLAACFAQYVHQDLTKGRVPPFGALILTLICTVVFANLGFKGIIALLTPILQVIYPGLILLSLFNIFHILYGFKMVKMPVFLSFVCAYLYLV